jgi:hypothetical protein
MTTKQPSTSNCAGCGAPLLERNRYFTGKFMTARDFQGEQDYLRNRQQLHNRMLHGWGIVAGLEVQTNPNTDCQSTTLVVMSGMALDCCGREVILAANEVIPVPRPSASGSGNGIETKYKKEEREERLLCMCYGEDNIELVPSIYNDSGCGPTTEQANRIRETPTFRLLRLDQVSEGCWKGGAHSLGYRDDCGDPIAGPAGVLLDPDCPCGTTIPLALVSYRLDISDYPIEIDTSGRRHLPINADFLTHIVRTNWSHGGAMTLHHLREELHGRLEIRFDRKIRPTAENSSTGVSEYTFIVQFGGIQEDIRYLPYNPDCPPELIDDCVAVFHIDPNYLDSRRKDDLNDKVVYVALKCDFIPDCRGLAVDGSFLVGVLPTHSGRMGGTFESWFSIEEEEDIKREPPAGGRRSRRRHKDEQEG